MSIKTLKRLFRGRREAGVSLLDVVIGTSILSVVGLMLALHLSTSQNHVKLNRDRVFAFAKAQAMLEELRAASESAGLEDASDLDKYDDGTKHYFTLTIEDGDNGARMLAPDHPTSGNRMQGGQWRYARRVTVKSFPGIDTRDLRIATVQIFKYDQDNKPGPELATATTVVRTFGDAFPPAQVFDVYVLALENVPGWWVNLGSLRPFVESSLRDVMVRNPGLELRTHWITKLSYGRNEQYTPYFNQANDSEAATPFVYFYPGKMPSGSSTEHYYVPERVQARANVDGLIKNSFDATKNKWPYALADQFNHCMRLADEQALFTKRVANKTEANTEPTWRLLLEDMNSSPDKYRNAIVVNLHGELLPMPPLRNYSDPAKSPIFEPDVRVVTHPEKLRFTRDAGTPSNSDDVRLRVYSYKNDPNAGAAVLDKPIVIEIPGMDLTGNINGTGSGATTLTVQTIKGGVDLSPLDGTRDEYLAPMTVPVVLNGVDFSPTYPNEPYLRSRYASGRNTTVLELHHSPLGTPRVASSKGLTSNARLYGLEYIPCSTESANNFSRNLASTGDTPKNTARWIITIPKAELGTTDKSLKCVTRIGSGNGWRHQGRQRGLQDRQDVPAGRAPRAGQHLELLLLVGDEPGGRPGDGAVSVHRRPAALPVRRSQVGRELIPQRLQLVSRQLPRLERQPSRMVAGLRPRPHPQPGGPGRGRLEEAPRDRRAASVPGAAHRTDARGDALHLDDRLLLLLHGDRQRDRLRLRERLLEQHSGRRCALGRPGQ